MTRSASSTSSCQWLLPNGGSPRQRRNSGRSAIASGTTIEAGALARSPRSRSSITSPQISRSPTGKQRTASSASMPPSLATSGTRITVREGCRASIPSSVRSATSSHSGGTQAMWVMTLVRWRAVPSSWAEASRSRASSASISATETSTPDHWSAERALSSDPPPGPPVALEQLLGRGRPPTAGRVVGEGGPVALPGGDDRVDERPLLLDLVGAGKQRRVPHHGVEDEALVGLRQPVPEGAAVEEVHVHGLDRHPLPGQLGADLERQPLVGLDVDEEDVRAQPPDR